MKQGYKLSTMESVIFVGKGKSLPEPSKAEYPNSLIFLKERSNLK